MDHHCHRPPRLTDGSVSEGIDRGLARVESFGDGPERRGGYELPVPVRGRAWSPEAGPDPRAADLGGDLGGPVAAVAKHGGHDGAGAWRTSWRSVAVRPLRAGIPSAKASFDDVRGHGLAGAMAGEQPPGVGVGGGREVEPLAGVAEQQGGEGLVDRRGRVAEPDRDLALVVEDIIEGQAQDAI